MPQDNTNRGTFDCCKQKIRKKARVSQVCCDDGHEALFHPAHLKSHLYCKQCQKPWTTLNDRTNAPYLKSLQTRKLIESAAKSLWNEFDGSAPLSYHIPLELGERKHLKSIVKLLEKMNFVGDRYSMGNPYLHDPEKLKAFCKVILLY